ncbi:MAG: hypothetical protein COA33_007080 [Fluviicola sp.]|nr:hypothetical protein [Fluviicola sp.]
MLKVLLIFLFISISGVSVSQTLPWFFNTHIFRNWAKEKEVKTLLFNLYEPIEITGMGGYTHFSSIRENKEIEYVKLSGHFRKYTLDSLGFVETMSIMSIGITYPKKDQSDDNTDYFKSVMIRMASEDYKPEKIIIEENNNKLGSIYYRFKSMIKDTLIQSRGSGIKTSNGIIYRESGTNHIDSSTSIIYNYDINLNQVISFNKNVLSQVDYYSYWGDYYEPIVTTKKYFKLNDSLNVLKFDGIYTGCNYHPCGKDTSFFLPYYKFHSLIESVNYKHDSLLNVELLNNSDAINYYGFSGFSQKYQKKEDCSPIIESYSTKSVYKRKTISYHSLRHSLFLSSNRFDYSIGYPFEMYFEFRYHIGLVENKGYGRTWSPFVNLKTESSKHKNGELKKVEHYCFNAEKGDWMLRSKEEYDKKGHLLSLELSWNNLLANYISYFGERSDLGFFERNKRLENCIIKYDDNSNIIIKNQNNDILVETTQSELILTDSYRSNDNTCNYESDNNQYCQAHYLIIR